jgi:hypothetical protein
MPTPYRSLYTYPWDIRDQGVNIFVADALNLGVTEITLATSYHAGKFIRPQSSSVIFPEDGVVYFDAQLSRYGEIKPQLHSDPALRRVLPNLLNDGRLRVHGWTVLLHNSRIGAEFPQYCAHNVFGDAYVYSLCPMHEAVSEYAINLSADLTEQHALQSIVLETPGWLPYAHGYHHEFAQIEANPWLDHALGLCFCSACKQVAKDQQINVDGLQSRLAKHVNNYFKTEFPNNDLEQFFKEDVDVINYIRMRQRRVTNLVADIAAAIPGTTQLAVIPSVQRPTANCWAEGSDLVALAGVADYLEIPFYESSAQQVLADAKATLQTLGGVGQVRGILRPGHPDLKQAEEIQQAITGLQELGIHDLAFYNYGLLPRYQLDKLAHCLVTMTNNRKATS